jgi:hypothetical protein
MTELHALEYTSVLVRELTTMVRGIKAPVLLFILSMAAMHVQELLAKHDPEKYKIEH